MAQESAPGASEFGASFKRFMDQMSASAPKPEPVFRKLLRAHLGVAPDELPIVSESFEQFDHPNLQQALDAWLAGPGRQSEAVGVSTMHKAHTGAHLTDLVSDGWHGQSAQRGPVEYKTIDLDEGRTITCIQSGLLLISREKERLACLVQDTGGYHHGHILIEVMASQKRDAERFLGELRTAMRARNVYRGHVISLSHDFQTGLQVHFHQLPEVSRESIILPRGILERIDRQTIGFSRHSEALAKAGRHLKRGVLLHGPPGTGKTLTAMYLARALEGRTVLLVTGPGQRLIQQVCWMARALQPSIVILEDADLIAEDRDREEGACVGPLLFELLNQMDGLAEDADILFLLTTNRPDILEPALVARPGRIDQAIEVPLPDADCRRRLLELYGRGLDLRLADPDRLIAKTEGASAAFVRELLRKGAVFACDEGHGMVVEDKHLDEALHELVVAGGDLTKRLLGYSKAQG